MSAVAKAILRHSRERQLIRAREIPPKEEEQMITVGCVDATVPTDGEKSCRAKMGVSS